MLRLAVAVFEAVAYRLDVALATYRQHRRAR